MNIAKVSGFIGLISGRLQQSETSNSSTSTTPLAPPAQPVAPEVSSPTRTCAPSPSPSDNQDLHEEEPVPAKRVRKPSQRVRNILEGRGATSARPSDPVVAAGVQVPPIAEEAPAQVLEGEGIADWMMVADFVDEYVMVAEMSDFEALEPRSSTEAKRHPDWQRSAQRSQYCRLKVGFLREEGRRRNCHLSQGTSCCAGILAGSRCRLFRHIRSRC